MAGCSIILCDMDQGYIRKLAAGLKRFFDADVLIQMCSHTDELFALDTDMTLERIVLCGRTEEKLFEHTESTEGKVRTFFLSKPDRKAEKLPAGEWHFIHLTGELSTDEADVSWDDEIYKYQPVSQIAARIQQYFPDWKRKDRKKEIKETQKWYGVFSVCRHESAIPFVCSLAEKLGEQQEVLVVLLMQFCGIAGLLDLSHECDTESFFLRLRRCTPMEVSQVAMPDLVSMPAFDLLPAPENPQVLYEMEPQDIQALVSRLGHSKYDSVIWISDHVIPGIEYLFARSLRLYLPEKTDTYSVCCQQEFEAFYKKLPGLEWEKQVRPVNLPGYGQMECGEHLLWQWSQSAIGSVAEQCVEAESCQGGT